MLNSYLHISISQSTLSVVLVGITGFFLLGPYSMLGGVCALDMGGAKAAATSAGLIDGVGYLGGVLAGTGVAKILTTSSWSYVFKWMAVIAALSLIASLFLWKVKPRDMQ